MSTPQFETIGKYVLLEKLAMGGMAEVFLARALGAGGISKFFAIKRILPQYADSPEFIDMFREEAKIAINLKHSNIVSIHEFGIQEQQFFLVMDYVEGRNLRQILNKMKKAKLQFSTEHIIYLIREIAAGLDHAHRCIDSTTGKPLNITHRDMSPQNVMVSFDGEVKIVDFGIAKAESQVETTRAGTLKGKFGYMSPEQAEGLSVDVRTDIFSLGIVMWEILANDRLFAANNEINTLRKIRDCHIPSLRKVNPNIHSDLEKIVQKALARDKNLRYQSAAALHKDLNRFLNRQYPDFSSHDFANHIKSIFADEILQSRKKLVSYAKSSLIDVAINDTQQQLDDKTVVTDSIEQTQTSSYVATETSFVPQSEKKEVTEVSIGTKTGATHVEESQPSVPEDPKTHSGILKTQLFNKPEPSSPGIEDKTATKFPKLKTKKSHFDPGFDPSSILREQDTPTSKKRTPSSTRTNIPVRVKRKRSPLTTAFLSLVAAGAVFLSLKEIAPGLVQPLTNQLTPLLGALNDKPGSADIASTSRPGTHLDTQNSTDHSIENTNGSTFKIIVASDPSGAEIYIDDQKTGQITPGQITVPNKNFKLSLTKGGYDRVDETITPENISRKMSYALDKLSLGYIDLDIKPFQEATIYIDGKKIEGEPQPLRNFPIPAKRNIMIKVVGKNGRRAQSTVLLRENEKKRVDINLGSGRRSPSNQ